ncbi:MAG: class I SAM-dependent methyltransferase [Acidobacteriota bacterium]
MSVASHLRIRLDEYDARIRTFIPDYERMIAAAAEVLMTIEVAAPHLVDLGTGTGALASKCLQLKPHARFTLVDQDEDILELARSRLSEAGSVVQARAAAFGHVDLPPCDAVMASLALHHIRTATDKRHFYQRCRAALASHGLLVTADCCPAGDPALWELQRTAWRAHLRLSYSDAETDAYFAAWAEEDVYFSLEDEQTMLRAAGFTADVVWRSGPIAVLAARPV